MKDANQAKLWIDMLMRARANVLERDESLGDDLGEICVHWADRLRALAFEIHGVLCNQCQGTGFKVYASTALWRGGVGGQSTTEGVCDSCWGTGRTDETGTDLRAIEAWAERIRAMSVEEISKRSEREVLAPMRAMGAELRGVLALEVIERFGSTDELHHLRWVVDQVARKLTGDGYEKWADAWHEDDHEWDEGTAP